MLATLGAAVDLRIYPGVGHDIVADEVKALREMLHTVRGPLAAAHLPP